MIRTTPAGSEELGLVKINNSNGVARARVISGFPLHLSWRNESVRDLAAHPSVRRNPKPERRCCNSGVIVQDAELCGLRLQRYVTLAHSHCFGSAGTGPFVRHKNTDQNWILRMNSIR